MYGLGKYVCPLKQPLKVNEAEGSTGNATEGDHPNKWKQQERRGKPSINPEITENYEP